MVYQHRQGRSWRASLIRNVPIVAALAVVVALPAAANTEISGVAGGACYTIVVPDEWNGDLVIFNHGYNLGQPCPVTNLSPLADRQLAAGFAVAASSYRDVGWALFHTKNDLQVLVNVFEESVGQPGRVFVTGNSLGGIVTAAAIEEASLGNVVGALTWCGVQAGTRQFDFILDQRLIYDALCSEVPGAAIPGGAEGLPAGMQWTISESVAAMNACFNLLDPGSRTPEQQERLDKMLDLGRLPANFLITNVGFFGTLGLADMVHDKLAGKLPYGNMSIDYGDPIVDARIERVEPAPGALNRATRHYTPTGNVGDTKIVTIHTDKDGLVPVENQDYYDEVVPPDQLTKAVAIEDAPTHCLHRPAEFAAAWDSLVAWVDGGPQPTVTDIQNLCLDLEADGLPGPCRFDPGYVIPDIDSRMRPRNPEAKGQAVQVR